MHAWTAENLFNTFFQPLYPEEQRTNNEALIIARTSDANSAKNPRFLIKLNDISETFARVAPHALSTPSLVLDGSDESIHRLGSALNRSIRDHLIKQSQPANPQAPIVSVVIHGAIYVSACIVRNHQGCWGIRHPLWESVVHLKSFLGEGTLTPFHWWLKALSDYEMNRDGLTARYRELVERATYDPTQLPKLISMHWERTLPPLKIVRYDTLYKYLRAHIPELKDLGRDFPSAESFAEIGFLELNFLILGEGQYLLMHGRGKHGLHLFWLDYSGFSHARFFPATPGNDHFVNIENDLLRVQFTYNQTEQTREMLWWG